MDNKRITLDSLQGRYSDFCLFQKEGIEKRYTWQRNKESEDYIKDYTKYPLTIH